MLHEVLNRAGAHFDRAISGALIHRNARSAHDAEAERLGHAERMRRLDEIGAIYDRPEHYDAARGFFAEPAPIAPRVDLARRLEGGDVIDLRWASGYAPHCVDVADHYLAHEPNRTAAARLYLHDGRPRPTVMLLHGYRCGQWMIEERAWPIAWLFSLGLDLAIAVAPFHAVRAHKGGPALFPSADPRITNEGFRQAVYDLRALAGFLRARGAPSVGAMGMSLGGYTGALLATVDDKLDFAVPVIPLASIAAVARDGGRLVGSAEEQRLQYEALERAYRVVSPTARPSRLAPERMLVIAASGDRITPLAHARRLAGHFGAPLETFPGGHVLQFGRAQGFRAAARLFGRLGLLEQR